MRWCELWTGILVALVAVRAATTSVPYDLYQLDSWEACDGRTDDHWYCMVRVVLSGKKVSEGPEFEINDHVRFRRNLLDRGICMETCEKESANAPVRVAVGPQEHQPFNDTYMIEQRFYPEAYRPSKAQEELISRCIHRRLSEGNDLLAYATTEYCLERTGVTETVAPYAYGAVFTLLLAIAVMLYRKQLPNLTESPSEGDQQQHLHIFDLYKCGASIGMVLSHCYLFGPFLLPMGNIHDIESLVTTKSTKIGSLVSIFLMQAFFMISAMLLTMKLLQCSSPNFARIVSNRWLRLTPLNILSVTFCSTLSGRFAFGPLAPRQLIVEQTMCRKHWWKNLLFLSNFNMSEPCMPHSWYVSADFQLFALVTALVLAMQRWHHRRNAIIVTSFTVSILIPFGVILLGDFDPQGLTNLHDMRFFLLHSRYLAQYYTPFYNNATWSVCGMVAGVQYLRFTRLQTQQARHRFLRTVNIFATVCFALLAALLHMVTKSSESSASRATIAFAVTGYKTAGAMLFSALFLRSAMSERDFAGSRFVRLGGRLYYAVYLVHFPIFRILFSNGTKVTHVGLRMLSVLAAQVAGMSILLAFVLHLTFEMPIVRFLRSKLEAIARTKFK